MTGVTLGPDGSALVVEFRLAGQQYHALNGGPHFRFTEAISLSIDCHTQAEVDDYWEKLSAGGATSDCGWLKDKYGLSWQVVPSILPELLADADRAKAARAMQAMMGMTKLDIAALRNAADAASCGTKRRNCRGRGTSPPENRPGAEPDRDLEQDAAHACGSEGMDITPESGSRKRGWYSLGPDSDCRR